MTEQKFNEVYEATKEFAAFKISRFISDVHTVEDILQKVYIKLFNSCPDDWKIKQYVGWLNVAAKYTAISYIQYMNSCCRDVVLCSPLEDWQKKTESSAGQGIHIKKGSVLFNFILCYPDQSQDCAIITSKEEKRLEALKKAIEDLPKKQKEAVELFYLKEMNASDIAKITKSNANAVYYLLHRARNTIKNKIKDV